MPSRMPDQTNAPPPSGTRIRPVPRTGALRLSPGQERLWFLDGLHGDGTEYLVWLRMRLRGPWDPRCSPAP